MSKQGPSTGERGTQKREKDGKKTSEKPTQPAVSIFCQSRHGLDGEEDPPKQTRRDHVYARKKGSKSSLKQARGN